MKSEGYIAMGGLITICAFALALVIKQVESSRCTKIRCCGLTCDRKVDEGTKQIESIATVHPRTPELLTPTQINIYRLDLLPSLILLRKTRVPLARAFERVGGPTAPHLTLANP